MASITARNRYKESRRNYPNPDGHVHDLQVYVKDQRGFDSDDHKTVLGYQSFIGRVAGVLTASNHLGVYHFPKHAHQHVITGLLFNGCAELQPALNQAYAQFRERAVGDNSSLGETFAEWSQSLSMVTQRGFQLARLAKAFRQRDPNGIARSLGYKPSRRRSKKLNDSLLTADDLSKAWMEFHWGWSPLIGDIFGAGNVISQPIPAGHSSGTGRNRYYRRISTGYDQDMRDIRINVKMGGDVILTNPNEFLLQRLGVANPLAVAWAIVPFSFLVDWCTRFGDYVESITDFAGTSIENSYTTILYKGLDRHWSTYPGFSGANTLDGVGMRREWTIARPLPNLQILANLGDSIQRAASAVTLATTRIIDLKR